MNEVSIIINGVRYDAVEAQCNSGSACHHCDLIAYCKIFVEYEGICDLFGVGDTKHFKESNKKFER